MPIPAIIPALIAAAGTIGGAGIQAASAKKNRESQERQNAIDRQRAATAYRTAVSDMRAAGMNPITGQNPPQAASTPMPAPQSDMTGVGQVLQQGASSLGDLLQRDRQQGVEQSLSWFSSQLNDYFTQYNEATAKAQEVFEQTKSIEQAMTSDDRQALRSIDKTFENATRNISKIDKNRQYSIEELRKLGLALQFNDGSNNSSSNTYGGDLELSFKSITDVIENIIKSKSKSEGDQTTKPVPGGVPSNTHNEGKGESEQNSNRNGNGKSRTFGIDGGYHHTDNDIKTFSFAITDESDVRNIKAGYISGATLSAALDKANSEARKTAVSSTINSSKSSTITRSQKEDFISLMDQYYFYKDRAERYHSLATDFMSDPGKYMNMYSRFNRGFGKFDLPGYESISNDWSNALKNRNVQNNLDARQEEFINQSQIWGEYRPTGEEGVFSDEEMEAYVNKYHMKKTVTSDLIKLIKEYDNYLNSLGEELTPEKLDFMFPNVIEPDYKKALKRKKFVFDN